MIDNGMEDWLLALSPKNACLIIFEIIVCAIHPIPGNIQLRWMTHDIQKDIDKSMDVPLDIVLAIPMFLRVYLLCRYQYLLQTCNAYILTNFSPDFS